MMDGKRPQTILSDQDGSILAAVKLCLPQTTHAFCIWHLTQKFPSWFRSLLGSRFLDFMRDFYNTQRLETISAFESIWKQITALYPELKGNVRWEGLYALREHWSMPFLRGCFFAGMSTTQRSESFNALMKRFMTASTTLTEFINHVGERRCSRPFMRCSRPVSPLSG